MLTPTITKTNQHRNVYKNLNLGFLILASELQRAEKSPWLPWGARSPVSRGDIDGNHQRDIWLVPAL